MIQTMTRLGKEEIRFRLFPKDGSEIIGSHSKNSLADLFTLKLDFQIQQPVQRRIKRIFDFVFAILILLVSPVLSFRMRHPLQFFKNILEVLIGQKSWVGYSRAKNMESNGLPILKEGILDPSCHLGVDGEIEHALMERINLNYAKDYQVYQDFLILINNWKKLDSGLFDYNR